MAPRGVELFTRPFLPLPFVALPYRRVWEPNCLAIASEIIFGQYSSARRILVIAARLLTITLLGGIADPIEGCVRNVPL